MGLAARIAIKVWLSKSERERRAMLDQRVGDLIADPGLVADIARGLPESARQPLADFVNALRNWKPK